jgi:hypothetical protein
VIEGFRPVEIALPYANAPHGEMPSFGRLPHADGKLGGRLEPQQCLYDG